MECLRMLCLLAGVFLFTACGTYVASYSIVLSEVESPADSKQQFGETKVVGFNEEGVDKYRYEDDYIDIIWSVGLKEFNFTLKNKSGHTLKINWDDVCYVDANGKVGRVMHSGVKYIDRNASQPPTTIPKGASLSDILLPTDNVYYISGQYGGWRKGYLVPGVYKTSEAFNSEAPALVGRKLTILMPIMIKNVQNEYTFTFNIDKLTNEAK